MDHYELAFTWILLATYWITIFSSFAKTFGLVDLQTIEYENGSKGKED